MDPVGFEAFFEIFDTALVAADFLGEEVVLRLLVTVLSLEFLVKGFVLGDDLLKVGLFFLVVNYLVG